MDLSDSPDLGASLFQVLAVKGLQRESSCASTRAFTLIMVSVRARGPAPRPRQVYNRYSKLFVHPGKAIVVVNGIGKSASLALICRILGTWAWSVHPVTYEETPPACHQRIQTHQNHDGGTSRDPHHLSAGRRNQGDGRQPTVQRRHGNLHQPQSKNGCLRRYRHSGVWRAGRQCNQGNSTMPRAPTLLEGPLPPTCLSKRCRRPSRAWDCHLVLLPRNFLLVCQQGHTPRGRGTAGRGPNTGCSSSSLTKAPL